MTSQEFGPLAVPGRGGLQQAIVGVARAGSGVLREGTHSFLVNGSGLRGTVCTAAERFRQFPLGPLDNLCRGWVVEQPVWPPAYYRPCRRHPQRGDPHSAEAFISRHAEPP